jgi:hypothetical protein
MGNRQDAKVARIEMEKQESRNQFPEFLLFCLNLSWRSWRLGG